MAAEEPRKLQPLDARSAPSSPAAKPEPVEVARPQGVIVNNFVRPTSPRPPSMGALPRSTAGGRVLKSTQPAPLLVLARGGSRETHNQNSRAVPSARPIKAPNSFQDLTPKPLSSLRCYVFTFYARFQARCRRGGSPAMPGAVSRNPSSIRAGSRLQRAASSGTLSVLVDAGSGRLNEIRSAVSV